MYLIVMMNYYSLVIGRMVKEMEKECVIEMVFYITKETGVIINQMEKVD